MVTHSVKTYNECAKHHFFVDMKDTNLIRRFYFKIHELLLATCGALFSAGFERTTLLIYKMGKFVNLFIWAGKVRYKKTPAVYEVTTIKAYLKRINREHAYTKVIDSEEMVVVGPEFYPGTQSTATVTQPEIYYALLEPVTIVGASNVVICDHETVVFEEFEKTDVQRCNFVSVLTPFLAGNRMILDSTYSEQTVDHAISLCGLGCENFYHWLYEYVARLKILEFADPEYATWPILLDSGLRKIPQLIEVLETYAPDREYIFVEYGHRVKVDKLLHLSLLLWTPFNLKESEICRVEDCIISPLAVDFIRSKMKLSDCRDKSKRIFISRKNFPGRRRINEEEVIEALRPHGFDVIYAEDLSFSDQMSTFQNAEIVIGVTGAALSNIVFCDAGTTIICLISAKVELGIFSNIANLLNLNLVYLAGNEDVSFENIHKPFNVDLTLLDELLRSTINN